MTDADAVSGGVGCFEPVVDQGRWFDGVLEGGPTVAVSGTKLALTRGRDRLIFSQEPKH